MRTTMRYSLLPGEKQETKVRAGKALHGDPLSSKTCTSHICLPALSLCKQAGTGAALAGLEDAFACGICKGYLVAPQTIIGCGHTFCSGQLNQRMLLPA